MTLVFDSGLGNQPSTHVLAIGVGRYPHLLGGVGQLAANPMGLKQLESPPVSVKALVEWFLAPIIAPGSVGFTNAAAPLGTIHALASANQPVTINTSSGPAQLDSATKANICNAFSLWLDAVRSNDENIGVFYFCGHGIMVSEHYLLAEDFGHGYVPWDKAFDISSTIRGLEREVNGALYFFLDACREISRDLALTIGATPMALIPANLAKKISRKTLVRISATGEGRLAFAPPGGQVSRFTKALLQALSGFAGTKSAGRSTWEVDGESLASAVRKILEHESERDANKKGSYMQLSEQLIQGISIPLIRMCSAPKVAVEVNFLPEHLRAQYELYLQSSHIRVIQTKEDKCLEAEVPMGLYTVGAKDPDGLLQPDVRLDEDLRPPRYNLQLGGQP